MDLGAVLIQQHHVTRVAHDHLGDHDRHRIEPVAAGPSLQHRRVGARTQHPVRPEGERRTGITRGAHPDGPVGAVVARRVEQGLAGRGVGQRVAAVRRHDGVGQDLAPPQPVPARRPMGRQLRRGHRVAAPPHPPVGIHQDEPPVVTDHRGRHPAVDPARGPHGNPRRPLQHEQPFGQQSERPGRRHRSADLPHVTVGTVVPQRQRPVPPMLQGVRTIRRDEGLHKQRLPGLQHSPAAVVHHDLRSLRASASWGRASPPPPVMRADDATGH